MTLPTVFRDLIDHLYETGALPDYLCHAGTEYTRTNTGWYILHPPGEVPRVTFIPHATSLKDLHGEH